MNIKDNLACISDDKLQQNYSSFKLVQFETLSLVLDIVHLFTGALEVSEELMPLAHSSATVIIQSQMLQHLKRR